LALTSSDLILILGNRIGLTYGFGDFFGPKTKLVQVDIEPEEIGRNHSIDLGILSDIKAFMTECTKKVEEEGNTEALSRRFEPWRQALTDEAKKSKAEAAINWMGEYAPEA
jgi:thiamine pyrophosphate-dependent acetolactate synthase large subunit-like protein